MRICAYGSTHPGQQRDHNEDVYLVDNDHGIFLVADGMGGHNAGEVASRMLANEVARQARNLGRTLRESQQDEATRRRYALQYIPQVIEEANRLIFAEARNNAARRGMGTTAVMFLPVGDEAYVCHVGDSRLYLLRDGELFQVTEDHSLVMRLFKQGQLEEHELDTHPHKNVITRCVGIQPDVEVDSLYLDLIPGDRFVLCSDGLSDMVSLDQLQELASSHSGQALVDACIRAANHAGGADNITVVIIEVEDDPGEEHAARLGMLQKVEFLQDIFLFADLNDQDCVKVNRILYEERYSARQRIIAKGDTGSEFYIVVDGTVGIWDGRVHLTSINAGGHFGEFALLEDQPRSADVWAQTDCVLLVIKRSDYLELVGREPVVAVKIYQAFLKHLADRVRDLSSRLSGG